jgi:FkbM family methyltransferase
MKIFDIGTNRGNFTDEYLSLHPNSEVVCIEANPNLCQYLVQKYSNNKNIQVYHYLISDESYKNEDFFIDRGCDVVSTASTNWVSNSRFSNNNWDAPIKIESITIDDLIKGTFTPDIIKIDVEGYENVAVRGLTKKIGMIQFEWAEEESELTKNTCEYLESIGYTEFSYRFEDRPYTHIPTNFSPLKDLQLFEQLMPSRKEKWGMIYAK